MSFACFDCRKTFKRNYELNLRPNELPCPQCGKSACNLGRHFKSPKQSDLKQWEKIRFLYAHGFRFQKIIIDDKSVPYPETLDEAKDFVKKYKGHAIKENE